VVRQAIEEKKLSWGFEAVEVAAEKKSSKIGGSRAITRRGE
jgi:hypothetical protein